MQWIVDAVSSLVDEYPAPDGNLQKKGMLSPEQLRAFFRAGFELLDNQDVKKQLRSAAQVGKDVEEIITELQENIFEKQGVEGNFGIACLGRVNIVYAEDEELMSDFYRFVEREERAVDEAELTPEELSKKEEMMRMMEQRQQQEEVYLSKLAPEERERVLEEKAQMYAKLQEERQKIEAMSPEEREKYQQMMVQFAQAQMGNSENSTMTPEQQRAFLQATAASRSCADPSCHDPTCSATTHTDGGQ